MPRIAFLLLAIVFLYGGFYLVYQHPNDWFMVPSTILCILGMLGCYNAFADDSLYEDDDPANPTKV